VNQFNGDKIYDSQKNSDPSNASICDFAFPQGRGITVDQKFKLGNNSNPDQVEVKHGGKIIVLSALVGGPAK
jgi:hypothetical protein